MNLRMIDLNLLVVLDAILTEKHIGRAGERLGLSASATSHALERLRKLLGDPLLIRTPTGMEPTPRALHMEAPLRQALSDVQATLVPQQFDPATATTSFTIAIESYETIVIMPHLLNAIQTSAPHIQLKLISSSPNDILTGIDQGPTDIAIGRFDDLPSRFMASRLMEDEFVCVMRADHPLAQMPLTRETYIACPHLLVSISDSARDVIDLILAEQGLQRYIKLQVPNAFAAIMALNQTNMISTLTRGAAKILTNYSSLCLKPLPFDVPRREFRLVWNQRFNQSASHRWLRKQLADLGGLASTTTPSIPSL